MEEQHIGQLPVEKKNTIFNNQFLSICWWAGLVMNIASWVALRFFVPYRIDPLNLHYSIYFGIDRIGSWWQMWLLPLGGLLAQVVNFSLIWLVYKKDPYIGRIFALFTLFLHLIIGAGALMIILWNRV